MASSGAITSLKLVLPVVAPMLSGLSQYLLLWKTFVMVAQNGTDMHLLADLSKNASNNGIVISWYVCLEEPFPNLVSELAIASCPPGFQMSLVSDGSCGALGGVWKLLTTEL